MWKKMIGPIVITVLMIFLFLGYLILCLAVDLPVPVKAIGALVMLSLMGVSVYVLVQRIREIRSGDEDDLSQY